MIIQGQTQLFVLSGEQLSQLAEELISQAMDKLNAKSVNEDPKLVTRAQASKMLGRSSITLWRWDRNGILTPIRIGSQIMYKRTEITNLLNGNTNHTIS